MIKVDAISGRLDLLDLQIKQTAFNTEKENN